jgi:hypothetical protein
LVEKLGPEVFGENFEKERIIKKCEFEGGRESQLVRGVFETLGEIGV